MKFVPHKYQDVAIDHMLNNKSGALLLGLGLGKTIITLTGLEIKINSCEINKPLIIAPKKVAEHTWKEEIGKWDHLKGLTLSRIIGDQKKRIKALNTKADIYIISRDNIAWLVHYLLQQPKKRILFDYLVLDELSSFKNRQAMRFKAVKKMVPHVDGVLGLTGTPAPNSLLDLWPQIYLLDQGERLGKTLTSYRDNYFIANYNGFGYSIREGVADTIHNKISDICISMSAEDYLDLPKRIDIIEKVPLVNKDAYEKFKKEEFIALTTGEEITPLSAAALYSKLLQFTNGSIYSDTKETHIVGSCKLDSIVESYEALLGQPVLIFYQFISDKERLLKAIPEAEMIKKEEDIERWNKGEIKCLIANPQSLGHGLNLQRGGNHMFWMGMPWSVELYLQAVGRLDRQGQTKPVINKIFIAEGTLEELVVIPRIEGKMQSQNALMEAVKAHVS